MQRWPQHHAWMRLVTELLPGLGVVSWMVMGTPEVGWKSILELHS